MHDDKNIASNASIGASVSFGDLLAELWRGRRAITYSVVVCMLVALFVAVTTTPVYRATTLLAPAESSDTSGGGLAGIASRLGGLTDLGLTGLAQGQDVDQALTMLTARSFTEQFIAEEGLLPYLYEDQWDSDKQVWKSGGSSIFSGMRQGFSSLLARMSGDVAGRTAKGHTDNSPQVWGAVKKFNSMREVDKDRRTQIITLSIKWKDPTLAAKWTNNLVRRLNDHARNRAIEEGQRAIGYLNEQIGKTSVVEMQQALFKLVEAQQKRIMLATIRQEYAFQVLDPALEPQERSSPRRTLMVLAGITIGGLLGMLAVLMRKYVFSRS